MSYHPRQQPVTYVVSSSAPAQSYMPSRSHHATSHSSRSRSGSHSPHHTQPAYHYNTGRRASVSGSGRAPTVYYVQNTRSREYEDPHRRSNAVYYVPVSSGSSRQHREYSTYDAGRDRHHHDDRHHRDRHHNEHRGHEREHVTYGNPGRRRHSHSEGTSHVSPVRLRRAPSDDS